MEYHIPAREVRSETIVINSRFIATIAPVFSITEARSFIVRIRNEFSDATHNVPAYIVGYGSSVTAHCSDDGEPSGTAGKPVLSVLQGSKLGDAAIVVTRYFGGTKLGTGGLVRAYTQAAKTAVDLVPRAVKIPTYTIMIGIPYSYLELIRREIKNCDGIIIDEIFGSEVTLMLRFARDKLSHFQKVLKDISHGELEMVMLEKTFSIIPIKSVY